MRMRASESHLRTRTATRVGLSAAAGLAVAAVTLLFGAALYAPAVGWDAAAVTFVAWTWMVIWRLGPERTAAQATAEDPTRALSDVIVLSAAVASLAAVGFFLVRASGAHGSTQDVLAAVGVLTVALSWFVVHTVFTLRYAMLYYSGQKGGIDFKQKAEPGYIDFAYVAFTIGMTFQVSDTDLQTPVIRSTALRHALLSFLFGAVILATTINLIAGLSSSGH